MQAAFIPKDIDRLLAEADELIKKIDSRAVKDIEKEPRIQLETHAQSLKKLRSEVQEKRNKEGREGSYSEGMHKAIDDIVTVMKDLKSFL